MGVQNAYPPRQNTKKRRRRRKKSSRTMLFSLGMLALIGVALGAYIIIFGQRNQTVSMSATPIVTTATYINTGRGLLYQSDGQVNYYDLKDSKKNSTFGMGAADIRMTGSSYLTAVFNSNSLQIYAPNTSPLAFTGTVKEAECGKNYLAVLRASDDGKESILIVTTDGTQVDQLTFDDQYIVDFGFYMLNGAEMLWYQSMNVNSGVPTTMISVYSLTKQATIGVMQIQNQLVDELYITGSSIFVAGTNQIIRYSHDGNKEVYRQMVYGYRVLDFSSAGDAPTFLMAPRGGDFHSVKILTLQEGTTNSTAVETYLQLPTEGVAAFIMGSRLVVVSQESVYIYSLKGKLTATKTLELPVDDAVKISDSTLMLSSNGIFYLASVS